MLSPHFSLRYITPAVVYVANRVSCKQQAKELLLMHGETKCRCQITLNQLSA